jgi:DNA-binding SARP family transcriptional activator
MSARPDVDGSAMTSIDASAQGRVAAGIDVDLAGRLAPPSRANGLNSQRPQRSVQFSLFGSIEVRTASRHVGVADFPSRKAKQVCELLVSSAGRTVTKDQLIESVWGEKLPRNPSAAIDHTMSILRSTLVGDDGAQPIVSERSRYRIDLSVAEIDIVRFDELVDQSSCMSRTAQLPKLLEAIGLVRGAVLEDEMYAPWAEVLRDRYGQRVQRVLLDLARSALVHDDPQLALTMAERARQESSVVLEEGYALCVSALMRLGRRHDARVLTVELEHRMAVELGAELASDTAMLLSLVRGSGAATSPEAVRVDARLTEPIDVLPFVGRDAELAVIDEAIARVEQGANELLIVQGASGFGKSSLMAALASGPTRNVRSFTCLPSDATYPLYVAHRLMRTIANEAGIEYLSPLGETVPAVFDRLAEMFDALGPTIIAIDDLHWADDASLAVIGGLVRPHAVRSLLVIAARWPIESRELDRCGSALGRSKVIELGPLPREVVDALPIDLGWDESGGHPGLLMACIEASRLEGRLSATAVADVLGWVGPTGSIARTALETAASIGPSFDASELAGRLGLSPTTIRGLLVDLERRHLVRMVDPQAGLYEFQAALTRRTLRETSASRLMLG